MSSLIRLFLPLTFAIFTATIVMAAPGASPAAPALTLKDVIGRLDGASRVERARAAADEASWKRVESYAGFLPSVTASGSYLLDKKYLLTDVQLAGSPAPISFPAIVPTTSYTL